MMRRLLFAVALLLVTLSGHAANDAKPNSLTSQEITDGWLLLFDGETAFGWKIEGTYKIDKGELILGGEKETKAQHQTKLGPHEFEVETRTEGKGTVTLRINGGKSERSLVKDDGSWGKLRVREDGSGQMSVHVPAGTKLRLRSIKLRPRSLQPIFNGKDLTGWKEHPNKKSKWSVKDGAIDLNDGPGDLQTEGQWADFVLQIECKSNGKQLNSGVFFRCLPGQYQQGYEAQIHNGWLPEATKEYTIDEFDPETGKVIKSDKIKSAAMDYGTGAIYRRMPARKAIANDNEWFTMTVAAQGRHLATWVNGIQVVDWTDTRPVKDNARNGCKLEKGNISLQGHDPTTDLSFRNIRIAELPPEKK
jgi:hypothetical protein